MLDCKRSLENVQPKFKSNVYQNFTPTFTASYASTQDTLVSQNTHLTNPTTSTSLYSDISDNSNDYSIDYSDYHPFKQVSININDKIHDSHEHLNNFFTGNTRSPIKINNHNDPTANPKYSIHTAQRTSVKNVRKSNIVLIDNIPYPTQLQFPKKISNRKSLRNGLTNSEEHIFFQIQGLEYYDDKSKNSHSLIDSKNKKDKQYSLPQPDENNGLKKSESYDLLLQVIDSYAE